MGISALLGIALNFALSGFAVFLLARWFLNRRWGVERLQAWKIAVAAGVLTNPAWVMIVWFI